MCILVITKTHSNMKKRLKSTSTRLLCGLGLFFLCFVFPVKTARAQDITVNFNNTPLINVLKEVQKQTPYKFVYNNSLVDVSKPVTVKSEALGIVAFMNNLLKGTDISYKIVKNQITLSPKEFKNEEVPTGKEENPKQEQNVLKGVITDEAGVSIPGVTIRNSNSNKLVSSDLNGKFQIEAKEGDLLIFSSIGMETAEVRVGKSVTLNITLKASTILLENIVVTGYQTLSRERATGSFAVVTSEKLENKLQPSLKSILEGQSAGVVLTKEGNLEIRGVSTISGTKDPLIVVDGYPLIGSGVGLESINPDNIETVTVLKDAVAASIYGARASNGVIVVTTKRASKGTFSLSYKGTYGAILKPELSKLNIASVEDYMDAELDLYNQNPNSPFTSYNSYSKLSDYTYLLMAKDKGLIPAGEADALIAQLKNNDALRQIQGNLIRPRQSQQHNISLTGGTDKNLFSGTVRYTKELQNVIANDNSRLTADIYNTWKPKSWVTLRVLANINYSQSNTTNESYSTLTAFSSTSRILPYTQLYDNNGVMTPWAPVGQRRLSTYDTYPGMKSVLYHPETDLPLYSTAAENLQIRMGGDVTINFFDFLNGSIGGSWIKGASTSRTAADATSFVMRTAYNDGTSKTNPVNHYIPEGGRIDENRGTIESWVVRAQLNYNQAFDNDKHRVTAMLGSEINRDTYENVYLPTRLGYNPVSATFNSGFDPYQYNNNRDNISGDMLFGTKPSYLGSISYGSNYGVRDNRFVSWYGNASYELNSKYLISGSTRLDLTNFFGTDPKYRYRPTWSVGGTYKISEEEYFSSLKPIFNRFNIRASYGINGNISLSYTPYLILSVGSHNTTTGGVSYGISSYPNNQLRWERTQIFDFGMDFSMFNNKVNIVFDFYKKKSTDLIASDAIDETRGTSSLTQNVGGLTNKGFELTINADPVKTHNFVWNTNFVVSHNTSNVDYYNVKRAYFTSYGTANGILVQGYPMDGFWGARFAGLNNAGTALFYNSKDEKVEGGSLKAEDAIYLGTLRPTFDLSWTNNFRYDNFEASIMFIGKFGHRYRKDNFSGSNYINRHVGERWKTPGDEEKTIYPVLKSWNMDMFYFPYSDVLVGNASYVKLRDFTLSYYLPKNIISNIGLSSLKLYFQTRNLFYITAKGVDIDPETAEVNTSGGTGAMTNQGFTSLQLRPEFYFGVLINL